VLCKEESPLIGGEEESEGCNRLRNLYICIIHLMEAGRVGDHWGGWVTV
jgi:hypothetical protein